MTVTKDLQSLSDLNSLVLPFLDRHQVPSRETYTVRLVVEELLTNTIKFTRKEPYADDVDFLLEVGDGTILLCLEYEGPDFDPRDAPVPDVDLPLDERPLGGLGLFLVQSMVDDLEYARIGGRNRVAVRIGTRQKGNNSSTEKGYLMRRILLAAVESKPYATAGGTSDVVGALTGILEQKGYDVRLVLPYYPNLVGEPKYQVDHLTDLKVPFGGGSAAASVFSTDQRTYLIGDDPQGYFARVGRDGVPLYPVLEDSAVHAGRLYAFFCRAVLELARVFGDEGWQPDVIHCHDWPAGLIPAYAKSVLKDESFLQGASVVYTIHNMSDVVYQGGWFGPDLLLDAGLPLYLFDSGQLRHNEHVNFVKAAIVFSDRVNTVSEGYATEIRDGLVASYETLNGTRKRFLYSGGLDAVWSEYGVDLLGIRNGIDDAYDPRLIGQGEDWQFVDEDLKANYAQSGGRSISEWAYAAGDPQLQQRKQDLKCYLQERCNRFLGTEFQVGEETPVVAVRSRLTEQKGFDLILRGLRDWRSAEPVQFVIVAWGEERYAKELRKLAASHPQWIAFSDSWRAAPEPLHYAGADFLLMPSLFEPCGLPHMMALRYGTIPIVRRTGGLADVVKNFDAATMEGNGFVFDLPEPDDMLQAIERAVAVYRQQPELWRSLLGNAMEGRDRFGQDFTWATAVERYIPELYGIAR